LKKLTIKNAHFTFFALSFFASLFGSVFEMFLVFVAIFFVRESEFVVVFVFDLLISI